MDTLFFILILLWVITVVLLVSGTNNKVLGPLFFIAVLTPIVNTIYLIALIVLGKYGNFGSLKEQFKDLFR